MELNEIVDLVIKMKHAMSEYDCDAKIKKEISKKCDNILLSIAKAIEESFEGDPENETKVL